MVLILAFVRADRRRRVIIDHQRGGCVLKTDGGYAGIFVGSEIGMGRGNRI